eukprot:CAMPEP_0168438592 /NCGR_PEP_ID=MMETSP0228-20121227/42039_1 /TAXON_ID=133427 /ORGANISM="Protoceratium reticulatum, Strain CCCM 535 (=CCMP 1889)" /LENGTH=459 /DNA_ID=CAMNT_0008452861 /DNA_START=1 /DNA_END=1376 /DNA_ORIENTATION=+
MNLAHLPSVYVSEVPAEFTEPNMYAFHSSLGLGNLAGIKFLPRKISGLTGSVMLRYSSQAAAQAAMQRLNGHPVNLSSGAVKYLVAKLADPPKGGVQADGMEEIPQLPQLTEMSVNHGRLPPELTGNCDPCSLYLADVPTGLTKEVMQRMHSESDLEVPSSVKFLPQKLDGETCCVILRYTNATAAQSAILVLHNLSCKTKSGKERFITARYASLKRSDATEDGTGGFEDPTAQAAAQLNPYTQYAVPEYGQYDGAVATTARGDDELSMLPSAYVSDLPGDISEDGVRLLLAEAGLDQSLLVCVKFLPRRIQVNSICAILRCNDMNAVHDMVNGLNGHQVTLPTGQTRNLIARVADPPKSSGKAAGKGAGMQVPAAEPTDLYVSEVPVEWSEDTIVSLHAEVGADPGSLATVKILERRHASYPTGAAILHYADHASAATAMTLLQGRPVNIPGGQRNLV